MVMETLGRPQTMAARSGKHPEAKAERTLTTWAVSGGLPRDLKNHNCSAKEDFRDKIIHLLSFWRGSAACAKMNRSQTKPTAEPEASFQAVGCTSSWHLNHRIALPVTAGIYGLDKLLGSRRLNTINEQQAVN